MDYPTRLGPEQRTLMLARWQDGQLVLWACGKTEHGQDATRAELESLSEVRASAQRLKGVELPLQKVAAVQDFTSDWPDWKREAITVCPVGEKGAICSGLRYDDELGLLFESAP